MRALKARLYEAVELSPRRAFVVRPQTKTRTEQLVRRILDGRWSPLFLAELQQDLEDAATDLGRAYATGQGVDTAEADLNVASEKLAKAIAMISA